MDLFWATFREQINELPGAKLNKFSRAEPTPVSFHSHSCAKERGSHDYGTS